MPTPIIHVNGDSLIDTFDRRGWTQGDYGNDRTDGPVCLYGAVRLCAPEPGDAYLIEQVKQQQGRGTSWNDDPRTTEDDVRAWVAAGVDVTDADLAAVFGPQWRACVALVRTVASATPDQIQSWAAATADATVAAATLAARVAATVAVRVATWAAVRVAAREAAWDVARDAAWDVARDVARAAATYAATVAAFAVTTWDLATPDGPYTTAHRDQLIAPYRATFGDLPGLLDEVTG